jgi:hypothetical protein
MKQIIIVLFICGGLVAGCGSNKGGSRSFGRKGSTAAHKPVTTNSGVSAVNSNSADSINVAEKSKESAELDSLLKSENNSSRRPGLYFNGSMGPGTGGSYASTAYRHDELNRKKYAKQALAKKKEQMELNKSVETIEVTDSLSTQADSTQYVW